VIARQVAVPDAIGWKADIGQIAENDVPDPFRPLKRPDLLRRDEATSGALV